MGRGNSELTEKWVFYCVMQMDDIEPSDQHFNMVERCFCIRMQGGVILENQCGGF